MKKHIYCSMAAIAISSMGFANNIQTEGQKSEMQNSKNEISAKAIETHSCTGDITIVDAKGNVLSRIQFSAPEAQNQLDCIGLYQVAVYKVTLILQQGQTTGGTITFI